MGEYFAELLGGVEKRVVGRERRPENEGEKEEELGREEVRRAIKSLQDKKAAEMDGISGEVWKYGREKMEK